MIKAIETSYAGHRFRSRLEARWAVFLDHLGIRWEYEPQGYVVNGVPYLPDFLVHPNTSDAFWLEIKGTFPSKEEVEKAKGLAEGSGLTTYVYWAKPEPPAPDLSHLSEAQYIGWDQGGYLWTDDLGWREHPTLPAAWELAATPTAFRCNPNGKNRNVDRTPGQTNSGFWWWTECPHCGHVRLAVAGQVGWCPTFDGRDPDEIYATHGPTWPRFGHRSPRLLAAYDAARSARFEHGESG